MKLKNYVYGGWHEGQGEGQPLYDAVTGELIAYADTSGIDMEKVLDYARKVGNPALRKLTFHDRGRRLKALALYLLERKEKYYELSYSTGATRSDSWIDIEGGIGNLFSYASLRRQFPNNTFCLEGEAVNLSKNGQFIGHHICVPKPGVAIHINAFNFPVWGMLEKIAVNLLAGVPAVVKPATVTSYLTELVFRDIIESGIFPEGSLQLICGSAGNILDYVTSQDVVTFTGSAETGKKLKTHPKIIEESVPFNMEADSLNAIVLGTDAAPGTNDFEVFIKEISRELTVKAGQKCTAIRRILVPHEWIDDVKKALGEKLSKIKIGNPKNEEVRMGALAGMAQKKEVIEKIAVLSKNQQLVIGSIDHVDVVDADPNKGAFLSPIVFLNEKPFECVECHEVEAFGPVSTIIPYKDFNEAITLVNMGKGSLVTTIVTSNDKLAKEYVLGVAPYHGRILVLNEKIAKISTGHGSPLPYLVHGGPGRAGGGEEMGGIRGVYHYLQRTAIQGHPNTITEIGEVFQPGSDYKETIVHPFRKHFEELEIGETIFTHKHTVTEADIVNFANVSGDNFYAHMDETSLEGTIFERRVAHGYFVLSKAAGLFVDPKKGPVLLNYGIENCRFTKPVYPGMTIGVKFTVKEKIDQEKKSPDDIAKGIVKFLVDVYDETGETVAVATILTMVKKLNQE
ncbi:MAG: bifunctional aldehyde dehydrogenase/enoyl-CoA hydratase [Vicingaceae bacterium]|nr:MAG: bifunctional aldehyde dehydrogenase/enoyl-CoA hydratase [Vicingaceae bacterium]